MTDARARDLDSLLQLMRWYYPPGVEAGSPRYKKTEQARRLKALLDGMARDMGLVEKFAVGLAPVPDEILAMGATVHEMRSWPAFMRKLKQEFDDCTLWNKTRPWADPCFACEIYLPNLHAGDGPRSDSVICLLSLLAPVYTIFGYHHVRDKEFWTRFPPLPDAF